MPESSRESLDEIDRLLLRELVADGRATLSALADKAGLSISAVQSRVRRLEAREVIRGYSAAVDPRGARSCCRRSWRSPPLSIPRSRTTLLRLRHIDAIESCHSVAGDESYILLVRVGSPRELEHLLQQIRATANVATRSTVILQTFYDR